MGNALLKNDIQIKNVKGDEDGCDWMKDESGNFVQRL